MKNFLLLSFLAPLIALGQATPANYPYSKPLPTNGGVARTISTRVSAPITPNAYDSKVPAVWDNFVGGGHRSVGTIAERNAINAGFRKEGMTVYVAEDGKTYKLGSDLTSWSEAGGSSGSVPLAAPSHYPGQAGGTSPIVGAATVISPGSGYWPNDYIEVQGGSGTAPSYLVVETITTVSLDIDNPGTGFSPGDILIPDDGISGTVSVQLIVDSVGESGEVTSAHMTKGGLYWSSHTGQLTEPRSFVGGMGSGFTTTNVLYGVVSLYVYADGSYTTMPTWPAATTVVYGSSGTGLTVRPWDVGAYEEGDTLTLAGGTTATVESTTISSVIIENGGVGYLVGDLFRGDWDVQSPIFRVSQVDDNNSVLAVEIQNGGRFWSTTLAPGEQAPLSQLRHGTELYQLYGEGSSGLRLIPTYGVYNATITSAGSFDGVNPVAQVATSGRGAAATFNLLTKDGGFEWADIEWTEYASAPNAPDYYWAELFDISYAFSAYTGSARRAVVIAREHSFPVSSTTTMYGSSGQDEYLYFFSHVDKQYSHIKLLEGQASVLWFNQTHLPDGDTHYSSFSASTPSSVDFGFPAYRGGSSDMLQSERNDPDAICVYNLSDFAMNDIGMRIAPLRATPSTILQMDGDSPYNYDVSALTTYGGDVTVLRDRINAQKDLRRFEWASQNCAGVLNFSGFDKLEYVDIHDNYLSSVDFTGCTALKELYMDGTYSAQNLVLTNLTSLEYVSAEYFGDNLSEPGRVLVANNPKLTYLDLYEPYVATNIVITNCPLLDYVSAGSVLGADAFGVSLELRDVPSLSQVDAGYGNLTNITLSGISSTLNALWVHENKLSTATINQILQLLDSAGHYSGVLMLQDQTPPAPPNGAGLISLTNLINRGWSVYTD